MTGARDRVSGVAEEHIEAACVAALEGAGASSGDCPPDLHRRFGQVRRLLAGCLADLVMLNGKDGKDEEDDDAGKV